MKKKLILVLFSSLLCLTACESEEEKKLRMLKENAKAAQEAADQASKDYDDLLEKLDDIEKRKKALGID